MDNLLKKYNYSPDKVAIDHGLEMIASNIDNVMSPDVLKHCLSMLDLTSLKTDDTPAGIRRARGEGQRVQDGISGLSSSCIRVRISEFRVCREGGTCFRRCACDSGFRMLPFVAEFP